MLARKAVAPASSGTRDLILEVAMPLFARTGYMGVSMRDIARGVGISAAALYHHFPDKESLYLAAVHRAFAHKSDRIHEALRMESPPRERLVRFVETLVQLVAQDTDFRLLLQRELLDADDKRLRVLATDVFEEQFKAVSGLAAELAPDWDAHMLVLSITGLVVHHFEMSPLRRFFPGSRPEHDDPSYIAAHVIQLLDSGITSTNRNP